MLLLIRWICFFLFTAGVITLELLARAVQDSYLVNVPWPSAVSPDALRAQPRKMVPSASQCKPQLSRWDALRLLPKS